MKSSPDAAGLGNRGYLAVVLFPWVLGLIGYWIIVAVDPYQLRHDRPPVHLGNHRYPDREWPLLIGPATAGPHDLVLLGSSTTMAISPDMMREAFPKARSPINLSYIAPRPTDMSQVLARVAQIKGLNRVILVMDFTLLERRPLRSATGETLANMDATSWSHSGDFALKTALASIHYIMYGTYDLPAWSRLDAPEFMTGAKSVAQSISAMRRFRRAVQRHADDVFAQSTLTCDQIPYLKNVLTPFLTAMAQKHVAVDMVFPPIPYILYYDWIENQPRFNILLEGPVFDQFMVFKKCVISVRDQVGSESNQVIALDVNDSLSGDLRHYMDSAHLIGAEPYHTVMQMIAEGDTKITSANIEEHQAQLRAKISQAGAQVESQLRAESP